MREASNENPAPGCMELAGGAPLKQEVSLGAASFPVLGKGAGFDFAFLLLPAAAYLLSPHPLNNFSLTAIVLSGNISCDRQPTYASGLPVSHRVSDKDTRRERPSGVAHFASRMFLRDEGLLPNSFSCNTYRPLRKCCKQKIYTKPNSFRCNTYKKPGRGVSALLLNVPTFKRSNAFSASRM
jgi:hypothetical protein